MSILIKLYEDWIRDEDQLPYPARGLLKLISHWIFQGIFRMDTSERVFKVLTTFVFSFPFYATFGNLLGAFLIGHTINFLTNSHVISALRALDISFYGEWDQFKEYTDELLNDLSSAGWVDCIYITGSVNRNEWSSGSDLDMIVIRKAGPYNAVKAVFGGAMIRLSATISLFPVDMYIFDSESTLEARSIEEDLEKYCN